MNRFAFAMMAGFLVLLVITTTTYTFSKCGWYSFALGQGAGMAAITGVCDKLNTD